ncbi:amidohydrolase family protein [Streptomyces niveus]|uniref:amidohydrolase family protein n=1 Tax=Streptomyces niveus TaxID=193462 RepID=UPI0035D7E81F
MEKKARRFRVASHMVAVSSQRGGSTIEPAHAVGATVIGGSGRDPGDVDVTVENGRITRPGTSSAHGEHLDAEGSTTTPGLIDAHVHLCLSRPIQPHLSFQISAAEIAADIFATVVAALDAGFTTVRDTAGVERGAVTATAKGKVSSFERQPARRPRTVLRPTKAVLVLRAGQIVKDLR